VKFLDAYPATDEQGNPSFATGSRPGIAINRRSGATTGGALWQIEYIAKRSRFHSGLIIHDLDDEYLALLMKAILSFNEDQLKVGGLTTKGFGRMAVTVLSSDERKLSLVDDDASSSFPTNDNNDDPKKLTKAIEKWSRNVWARYMSTKSSRTKSIKEPSITDHGSGAGRKYVSVVHRRATDRTIVDKKKSGIVKFAMIPRTGYYLFIGSGTESLPDQKTHDLMRKKIENQADFSKALSIARKLNIDRLDSYQSFAKVLRLGKSNQPVIPGSTLKGAFRSRIEHTFKPHDGKVNACFVKQSKHLGSNASTTHLHLYGKGGEIPEREFCKDVHNPCVVCDMFGMTGGRGGLKALVEVHDARLARGALRPIEVDVGRGTARLLAVGNEKGEDSPAPIFRGSTRFTNLTKPRLGLLFIGMAAYATPRLRLGRFRYRDKSDDKKKFGLVSVIPHRIQFDDGREIKGKKSVQKFIISARKEALKEFGDGLDIPENKKKEGK
jgi:CRISPR/Cas system CSM-associated protein Csm3 (group 7 of RAMP superfamily)